MPLGPIQQQPQVQYATPFTGLTAQTPTNLGAEKVTIQNNALAALSASKSNPLLQTPATPQAPGPVQSQATQEGVLPYNSQLKSGVQTPPAVAAQAHPSTLGEAGQASAKPAPAAAPVPKDTPEDSSTYEYSPENIAKLYNDIIQGNKDEWGVQQDLLNRYQAVGQRRAGSTAAQMGSYGAGLGAQLGQSNLNFQGKLQEAQLGFMDQQNKLKMQQVDKALEAARYGSEQEFAKDRDMFNAFSSLMQELVSNGDMTAEEAMQTMQDYFGGAGTTFANMALGAAPGFEGGARFNTNRLGSDGKPVLETGYGDLSSTSAAQIKQDLTKQLRAAGISDPSAINTYLQMAYRYAGKWASEHNGALISTDELIKELQGAGYSLNNLDWTKNVSNPGDSSYSDGSIDSGASKDVARNKARVQEIRNKLTNAYLTAYGVTSVDQLPADAKAELEKRIASETEKTFQG